MRFRLSLVAAWSASSAWLGSNSGLSIAGLFVILYGGGALLAVWLVSLVLAHKRSAALRRRWLEPAAVLLVVVLVASGVATYARFLLSEPALYWYVQAAGSRTKSAQRPQWAGFYRVLETEVLEGGTVRLITAPCMFNDCGFVYTRDGGRPPRIGEDQYRPLTDHWWLWSRSW